jgi:hypothetical protein
MRSLRRTLAAFPFSLHDLDHDRGCVPEPPGRDLRGCFPGPPGRDLRGCVPSRPASPGSLRRTVRAPKPRT